MGRDFAKLLGAQTVSNLGDGVRAVAIPWLASLLTRDPFLISLTGVASTSAWLVFSLLAGGLADRFERRRTIVGALSTQCLIVSAIAAVVYFGRSSLGTPADPITIRGAGWWLACLAAAGLALSMVEVLRDITAQALVPELIDHSQIERANGRIFAAESVMNQLVGPPLGGLLVAWSIWVPFGFDALTFVLSAGLVARIASRGAPASRAPATMRSEIGDAISWLWRHPVLRSMTTALAAHNFLNALAFTTFVLFVQDVIGLGVIGFALVNSGGAVAGVLASIVAARVIRSVGRGRLMVLIPVVNVVMLVVIGLTSEGWVVWMAIIPMYFLGTVWSVLSRSLRQRLTPIGVQGRVTGAHRTLNFGAVPLGVFVGGALAGLAEAVIGRTWALRTPFLVAAVAMLGLVPFVRRNLSERDIQAAMS